MKDPIAVRASLIEGMMRTMMGGRPLCAFCGTVIIGEGFGARAIALPCPWGSSFSNEEVVVHPPCYVELVNIVRRVLGRVPDYTGQ